MPGLRSLQWGFLGRLAYRPAVDLQESIRARLQRGETDEHLLLLEHPHVYTLGRSASQRDVLAAAAWLRARGATVEECDRGGQVTYHGPGQLVGYPIIDLDPDRRDLRRYVRDLQQVLVRTLARFGVEATGATDAARIGVWVGPAKIASIGVHVKRWVTTHGFALNVTTDLDYFSAIVPCGLPDVRMTSIEHITGQRVELPEVAAVCAAELASVFDRELEQLPDPTAVQSRNSSLPPTPV